MAIPAAKNRTRPVLTEVWVFTAGSLRLSMFVNATMIVSPRPVPKTDSTISSRPPGLSPPCIRRPWQQWQGVGHSAGGSCASSVGSPEECWNSPRCRPSGRRVGFRRSGRLTLCLFGEAMCSICAIGCDSRAWQSSTWSLCPQAAIWYLAPRSAGRFLIFLVWAAIPEMSCRICQVVCPTRTRSPTG